MDELKNLVLQTLESKGVLGQIRAKLRTCVFKVIEQEDANLKGSGNYLENPLAAKITDNEDGQICAELIRDFLEFYKMDYTMQIFVPECNLTGESKVKDKIPSILGVSKQTKVPLLTQLVQMVKSGIKPNINNNNFGSPLSIPSEEQSAKKIAEKVEFSPLVEDIPPPPPKEPIRPKEISPEVTKPVKKEEPKPIIQPIIEKPAPAPITKDPLPPLSSIFLLRFIWK